MIKLSDAQIDELRQLQQQTVDDNPGLKIMLDEICYINPTAERPWDQNYDVGQYTEFIENFNSSAYNKYMALLKTYNLLS